MNILFAFGSVLVSHFFWVEDGSKKPRQTDEMKRKSKKQRDKVEGIFVDFPTIFYDCP